MVKLLYRQLYEYTQFCQMRKPAIEHIKQPVRFEKNFFEKSFWKQQMIVVGIDEVGRGCLAGPLVTAAVALPMHCTNRRLKDSKIMSENERLTAYNWIVKHCFFQTGIVHHRIIDQHNIWHATLIAMKKAVVNLLSNLNQKPGAILVDAMPLSVWDTGFQGIPVYYFPKGEDKSSSIAAASIVAKVTRDALMTRYDTLFPGYEFCHHKGYATPVHQQQITTLRHSIIHRLSFLSSPTLVQEHDDFQAQQQFTISQNR